MANDQTAIAVPEFNLPDESKVRERLTAIAAFRDLVRHELEPDVDYGVIPGTPKPTLLLPGAQKITKLLQLADTYDILREIEDWDRPLFAYTIKCQLIDMASGQVIAEGLGECNSYEGKYRWRQGQRSCPKCGAEAIKKSKFGDGGWYCFDKLGGCGAQFPLGDDAIEKQKIGKVPNDDIFSQVNTILKMAKKRALVDAALSAGRLSNIFTQDMEDMKRDQAQDPKPAATKQRRAPRQSAPPPAAPERASEAPEATAAPQDPDPTETAPSTDSEPDTSEPDVGRSDPKLETLGDLLGAAHARWSKFGSDVAAALGVKQPVDITDYPAAWAELVKLWG